MGCAQRVAAGNLQRQVFDAQALEQRQAGRRRRLDAFGAAVPRGGHRHTRGFNAGHLAQIGHFAGLEGKVAVPDGLGHGAGQRLVQTGRQRVAHQQQQQGVGIEPAGRASSNDLSAEVHNSPR